MRLIDKIIVRLSLCTALLLSIISIHACDRNNPTSTNENTDVLMPLTVGNYWAYEYTFNINGEVAESSRDSFVVRIIGDTSVTNERLSYKVAVRDLFHPKTNTSTDYKWFNWYGEYGLYFLGGMSSTDTLVHKFLEIKYPVEVGDSWEVPRLVYNLYSQEFYFKETLTYTCIATDTGFTTTLGTFKCYVYHYQRSQGEDILLPEDVYDCYAPGIGLVGREIDPEGIFKDRVALYEFHINKGF